LRNPAVGRVLDQHRDREEPERGQEQHDLRPQQEPPEAEHEGERHQDVERLDRLLGHAEVLRDDLVVHHEEVVEHQDGGERAEAREEPRVLATCRVTAKHAGREEARDGRGVPEEDAEVRDDADVVRDPGGLVRIPGEHREPDAVAASGGQRDAQHRDHREGHERERAGERDPVPASGRRGRGDHSGGRRCRAPLAHVEVAHRPVHGSRRACDAGSPGRRQ
jgi:hypothetical protein